MKHGKAILTAATCVLACCLALAGCGGSGGRTANGGSSASGSSGAARDAVSEFEGYWQIESAGSEEVGLSAEDIQMLRDMGGAGNNLIVYLAADGTGTCDSFGDIEDVTWDAAKKTMTASDGETMGISIKDGKLEITDGANTLILSKGDDSLADQIELDRKVAEEGASGAAIEGGTDTDAQTEAMDPVTVADDDLCTITISEKAVDDWGDCGYTFDIANKSDRRITVWSPSGKTAVNGRMNELYLNADLLAGTSTTTFGFFDDIGGGLGQLVNVQTTIQVYDADTYEDLASYTVTIP